MTLAEKILSLLLVVFTGRAWEEKRFPEKDG